MRLIDADALRKKVRDEGVASVYRNIQFAPTIDAIQVRRGRWIKTGARNIYGGIQIECSECGERYLVQHIEDELFCRHCGAKMEADRREE